MMKKTSVIAAVSLAAVMLTSCANGTFKKTAMEIGDVKVSGGDIATLTYSMASMSGQDFDSTLSQIPEMVEMSFQYGAVGKAMGIELTEDDKSMAVQTRAQFASNGGGLKDFTKFLKDNGSSIEFYDKLFEASAYQTKVNEKIEAIFEGKDITEDEINKYYKENYYHAKHILISKPEEGSETKEGEKQGKELADELLERAKNGEDFDALISEYSEDPGSESEPDGYVFTDGYMVKPFENAVKALKVGEFGFCESDFGYHVILRLDLPEIGDKTEEVKSVCESKRIENKLAELCEEHGVKTTTFDDVISSLKEDMLKNKFEAASSAQ